MVWDLFLGGFYSFQCINILVSFTQSMLETWFSIQNVDTPANLTVYVAMEYVARTFRDNNKVDPSYDKYSNLARLLHRQYKGYKNVNPL